MVIFPSLIDKAFVPVRCHVERYREETTHIGSVQAQQMQANTQQPEHEYQDSYSFIFNNNGEQIEQFIENRVHDRTTGRVLKVMFTDELRHWGRTLVEDGRPGFAREFVRKLFAVEERKTINCRGMAKKRRLDPFRINAIKEEVFTLLPCASNGCIKSIDAMNWDLVRRGSKQNLLVEHKLRFLKYYMFI